MAKNKNLELYLGQVDTPAAQMSSQQQARVDFVRQRLRAMSEAKVRQEHTWRLIKELYQAYEKHLEEGSAWNTPYRFAELFGAIQRKYADLVDNLPEAKVTATRNLSADFAIGQQATLQHTEKSSNSMREKARSIWDSVFYGAGPMFEGYTKTTREITLVDGPDAGKKVTATLYDGLVSERVDPRDFFIDESATVFYDETGINGARDCARRRLYPYSTFREKFSDKQFYNIDSVVPVSWGSDHFTFGKLPFENEMKEQKTSQRYVAVFEYWNQELDMLCLVANGIEIYHGANPFRHKQLPFVMYYNYRKDDSVWGISEAEILAPFIFSKEEIMNLMILDAKLALQPALAVSGDVMFNTEENELQPGAIFTLRGLNGGKVADAVQPLRFGGVPAESFDMLKQIEDWQIVISGDDIRALYANPDQLATQTLSKREVAQKRLRSIILQNTMDTERIRVKMRLSNINQFYAQPYLNMEGRVVFRRIKIDGYEVFQGNDESKPKFVQQYGAQSYFTLNRTLADGMEDIEVEIVDSKMDADLKKEKVDDMLKYLETLVSLLVYDPSVLQMIDMKSLLKQIARNMDLDYHELFKSSDTDETDDSIDLELQLIKLGIVPEVNPAGDPIKAMDRYVAFLGNKEYAKLSQKSKLALQQLIFLTTQNVPIYFQQKLQEARQREVPSSKLQPANGQDDMGNAGPLPGHGIGQGNDALPRGTVPPGNGTNNAISTPSISSPTGVAKRLGFRENKPH